MRILYYNWAPFYKKNNPGGGVNIYQNNLIDWFSKDKSNNLCFLSSGMRYSFFSRKPFIRETTKDKQACRTFELVNSPIVAPMAGVHDFEQFLKEKETYKILKTFIKKYGPFDVIHFNNIEGLGSRCLEIKKDFPDMKVVYSLHNYILFCPNGYLFYDEKENCFGKDRDCSQCLKNKVSLRKYLMYYRIDDVCSRVHMDGLSDKIKNAGKNINSHLHRKRKDVTEEVREDNSFGRLQYRKKNVFRLNKYVDCVLAVSERVRQIAIAYGVDESKVITNYIGSKFAETSQSEPHEVGSEWLTIAYMGFLKKEKGIEFLLDALDLLDREHAKKLTFKCYARNKGTEYELSLIRRIREIKIGNSEYYNGYTHDELPGIMKSINVGIVPVIWEDNLPQVAIEFASNGVPVLSSDLGGARELTESDIFVYDSASPKNLAEKITFIMDNPESVKDYYRDFHKPTTMQNHIDKLKSIYAM